MVHSPALSPACSRRGSPLTSTQPSRRSTFSAINACQQGIDVYDLLRRFYPVGQIGGQGVAEGGGKFIEPGAGNLLALQAVQAIERTRSDLRVLGSRRDMLARASPEIHQAATEAEEHGSQAWSGDGQGFSMGHFYILEIITSLFNTGDSCVTRM
jgi:hypothetical protein